MMFGCGHICFANALDTLPARAILLIHEPCPANKSRVFVSCFVGRHDIMATLAAERSVAMASKEAARTTGLSSVQISRRTADMQSAGLIRATGAERDGCRVLAVVI